MLKKAGNIVIIVLLLVATGGMPVTRHYCGLVQKSVSFYTTPKACCGGSCDKCHNVFKFTKVNDDFESGSSVTAQALIDYVTLHTSFCIDLFDSLNSSTHIDLANHRTIFTQKAGHSPASLGNFRC
ncbi:MAG: hypothetical protein Q7U54_18220 [Bacteroidales bacterium]|nr:hypothetical protein [Bacteroidales bacterium]